MRELRLLLPLLVLAVVLIAGPPARAAPDRDVRTPPGASEPSLVLAAEPV